MHFFTSSDFYTKANLQIPITVYYYGILRVEVVYFLSIFPLQVLSPETVNFAAASKVQCLSGLGLQRWTLFSGLSNPVVSC